MKKKRWLEWTLVDPRSIVGGVETHLLSMASCLERHGYEVSYSSDPEVLFRGSDKSGPFDVVRTHGAALPPRYLFRVRRSCQTFRVHTLHGSSVGLMLGLKEWYRVTHYKAFYREISGCLASHLVASIHPGLFLYQFFYRFGRAVVIWNGWDSRSYSGNAEGREFEEVFDKSWAFIGRLWDRTKAADRVVRVLARSPSFQVVAIPGDGMVEDPRVVRTGRLTPAQVSEAITKVKGVLLPSRYEGLSLVLLESLANGVPVLATSVGGHRYLKDKGILGLVWLEEPDSPRAFVAKLAECERDFPRHLRESRAKNNQAKLWTWEQCADLLLTGLK